jgi:hypothetical protein
MIVREQKSAFQLAWEAKELAKQQERQAKIEWKRKMSGKLVSNPFAALLK